MYDKNELRTPVTNPKNSIFRVSGSGRLKDSSFPPYGYVQYKGILSLHGVLLGRPTVHTQKQYGYIN